MKKKKIIWLVIFLGLILALVISYSPIRDVMLIEWSQNRVREYPEGETSVLDTFIIDPETILISLDQGKSDVFMSSLIDPDELPPQQWPSGSFSWDDSDYLKIANAIHHYYWKETLDNWQLIHATFRIEECQDVFYSIDFAGLSFYQHKNEEYVVHTIWISPLRQYVTVGDSSFLYTGKWVGLDFNKAVVGDVDSALRVAEKHGGKQTRLKTKDNCGIRILLSPYVFNHLFDWDGWGWDITYWGKNLDRNPGFIFRKKIDPYTGK